MRGASVPRARVPKGSMSVNVQSSFSVAATSQGLQTPSKVWASAWARGTPTDSPRRKKGRATESWTGLGDTAPFSKGCSSGAPPCPMLEVRRDGAGPGVRDGAGVRGGRGARRPGGHAGPRCALAIRRAPGGGRGRGCLLPGPPAGPHVRRSCADGCAQGAAARGGRAGSRGSAHRPQALWGRGLAEPVVPAAGGPGSSHGWAGRHELTGTQTRTLRGKSPRGATPTGSRWRAAAVMGSVKEL